LITAVKQKGLEHSHNMCGDMFGSPPVDCQYHSS